MIYFGLEVAIFLPLYTSISPSVIIVRNLRVYPIWIVAGKPEEVELEGQKEEGSWVRNEDELPLFTEIALPRASPRALFPQTPDPTGQHERQSVVYFTKTTSTDCVPRIVLPHPCWSRRFMVQ